MSTLCEEGEDVDFVAVTVVGPSRVVDVSLPASIPVWSLLDDVAQLCGVEGGQYGWQLARLTGELCIPQASLRDSGVMSGSVVVLSPTALAPPPPRVIDLIDDVAARTQSGTTWRAVHTQRLASVAVALFAIVLGVETGARQWLPQSAPASSTPIAIGCAAAGVLLAGLVMLRRQGDKTARSILAAASAMLVTVSAWRLERLDHLTATIAGLLTGMVFILVGMYLAKVSRWSDPVAMACVVGGALVVPFAALTIASSVTVASAAMIMVSVLMLGGVAALTVRFSGLMKLEVNHRPDSGLDPAIAARSYGVAAQNVAAVLATLALAIVIWGLVLLRHGGGWSVLVVGISAALLLIRAASFRLVPHVAPLAVAGILLIAFLCVLTAISGPRVSWPALGVGGVLWLAYALTAIGRVTLSAGARAVVGKWLPRAESLLVIGLVISTAGASGLFSWISSVVA